MSKFIRVRLVNRRPGDTPRLMRMIADACPSEADLELEIDCRPTPAENESNPTRKDERLETEVNREISVELDRLEQLAEAVRQDQAEQAVTTQASLAEIVRRHASEASQRMTIRSWFTESAKAGWTAVVKVVVETWMKSGQ